MGSLTSHFGPLDISCLGVHVLLAWTRGCVDLGDFTKELCHSYKKKKKGGGRVVRKVLTKSQERNVMIHTMITMPDAKKTK